MFHIKRLPEKIDACLTPDATERLLMWNICAGTIGFI